LRVVITGAAGFVGSHLSEQLIGLGHQVSGIDAFIDYYPRPYKEANLVGLRRDPRFTFHELDLRSADLRPVVEGADAIIHLAAMPGLAQSWVDVDAYIACNLTATHRIVDAALAARVPRFLHASTSSVYGTEAVGDESSPTRPISPYGVTKLAAEHLVLAYTRTHGLPASIVRYFSIYGPRQRPDMGYHLFIEAMLDGRPITIYGDGEQSRTNAYIDDAVRGTIAALEGAPVGEIFNLAGHAEITVNEAIATIGRIVGVEPRIEWAAARPGDQRRTAADTGRAERTFGYRPRVLPADGLAAQVAWHRTRRGADADGRSSLADRDDRDVVEPDRRVGSAQVEGEPRG
jgi:nucleoside-diphosphate-sugar epimerase